MFQSPVSPVFCWNISILLIVEVSKFGFWPHKIEFFISHVKSSGLSGYFCRIMLSAEEKEFIEYWEQNRDKRKKVYKQLFIGLPFGVLFVAAILISSLSGWYKRATMTINVDSSSVILLLVASLLIVAFIVIFSARHRWEMDEQRYQELKGKEGKS